MALNILIPMDESDNAFRAVKMVAENFSPENKVTLFSVLLDTAALCKMESPELTPIFKSQQTSFCALEDKKRELVEQAMHKAKKSLVDAGFDQNKIKEKLDSKKYGVARDIIKEAEIGYDLIVMGRRGISGVKEFFLGSTSQKVFNGAKNLSVLIVN